MGQIVATCLVDNCFAKQSGGFAGDILLEPAERDVRLLESEERRAQQKLIQNIVQEEYDRGRDLVEKINSIIIIIIFLS